MATGLMRRDNVHELPVKHRPDHLFDDLGSLANILRR
jgi:hypothetical protein